ncbi:MAG TPA: antitoxin YezG family protein [Clostridia bacterium]
MNTSDIEKVYQKIANTLNETIPEEWDRVYMYGEISEGAREAFFNYYPKESKVSVYSHDIPELFEISEDEYDKLLYELLDNVKELWQEFKNSGEEVWTNLTFILESTGKFKIDYDYTDLSEASPRKQHIIWKYKYLGIIPKDENDKKIIDEYLKAQDK